MNHAGKETAWKKSRKFGDVKGGRRFPKVTDNILKRFHSLQAPSPQDELPIFRRDNPLRDFNFPIDENDIRTQPKHLPNENTEGLTHIWLRRIRKKEYESGEALQGMFIRGSGVFLVVINPFPKNLRMVFGNKKPSKKTLKEYSRWTRNLVFDEAAKTWHLQWTEEAIHDYYLNTLLLHEIGHFVDKYSPKTKSKEQEDFADAYALIWHSKIRETLEKT